MNIKQLKDRLSKVQGKGKQNDIWKPTDEHEIRLIAQPDCKEPLIERWFHYGIGDVNTVLCPKKNFGEDCVICDFADKLYSWKDPETGEDKTKSDKESDYQIYKEIRPKVQFFALMIERGKEKEGVKYIKITPGQAEELIKECEDSDNLESIGLTTSDEDKKLDVIFGTNKAFDIAVSYAKAGEKGNNLKYAQTKFKVKRKPSLLAASQEDVKKLLNTIKSFTDVYPRMTSEEVEKAFEKFINSSKKDEKVNNNEGVKYAAAPKKNSNDNAANVGKKSLEEAFDELEKDA
jgi:hypothetical protein